MATTITIAIIGATGNMGSAIIKSLVDAPYRLLLISGDEQKLQQLLEAAGNHHRSEIEAIHCTVNACWEADLVIAAVPYEAEKQVAEKIKQVATGKIVISISNPVNRITDVNNVDTSAAEKLQQLLPYSKVVKAFNTIESTDFLKSCTDKKLLDVFVAGDDETSVSTVCELVKHTGFHPVKAGGLAVSRNLENMEGVTML